MHLHIGQHQNDTHAKSKQVVSHEITCNPTDDTACNDELWNSFASYCCDSNHGLNFMYNQMNNHQSHHTCSNSGDYAAQQVQTFCLMLPTFANEHDQNQRHQVKVPMAHHNHHLYHQ